MGFINPRQICKFQNDRLVVEFNDKLFPANAENAANLHASYSKIYVVGIDTTNGKGPDAVVADCNIDPIKVKRLYEKVLFFTPPKTSGETGNGNGNSNSSAAPAAANSGDEIAIGFGSNAKLTPSQVLAAKGEEGVEELKKIQELLKKNAAKYPINTTKIAQIENAIQKFKNGELGTPAPAQAPAAADQGQGAVVPIYREQKINPNAANPANGDEFKVTLFSVEYNPKMRSPWTVIIENGWGQLDRRDNGGTAIKRGSYRKEKTVKAFIDDERFRELMRECNDYVVHFEQYVFGTLMKEREAYEKKQKETQKQE